MTEAALLEALRAASQKQVGGDGMSTKELTEALGVGERAIRALLREGIQQGTITHGSRVIKNIAGQFVRVTTYKLV